MFPSYPCLMPTDTITFRNSIAKYLESLRHRSLHSQSTVSARAKAKDDDNDLAWWWKDVVVRKSLLEECSGER